MDQVIQTVIIGLSNGLIFALVALGYTLVYGIIELINFAHGDLFMLGSMVALFLIATVFHISAATPPILLIGEILLIIALTMLITAAINVTIERIAYRPLRHAPKLAPLISAIGMSFVLQNVALLIAGPANKSINNFLPTTNLLSAVGITSVSVTLQQVFVGMVTLPLLVALSWFVGKTRQGRAMRATAQDPDTAGLMGVDVNRTIALTFLIGGALAGAAGVVQILYNNVTVWNLGFRFGLNAFTSAVLGGIGNLSGAVVGALVLGQINAFSDRYLSANWTNAIVFGVLIAVLVFKPTGILGQQLADRA
jgi:branched-chain amino acid transport system permease protein